MPGAFNQPWSSLARPDGRLLDKEALAPLLAPYLEGGRPIVTTCGSGVSAAVVALALARLGRWDVSLYDGSWAEWGARDDTPITTGP